MKLAEGDQARIAIIPRLLMDVKQKNLSTLSTSALTNAEQYKEVSRLRFRLKFICYDIHLAAYILDPRMRGEGLSDEEVALGIQVIESVSEFLMLHKRKVLANVINFRTKNDYFGKSFLWESVNDVKPPLWWEGMCKKQPATPVAIVLLNLVPSAAACERNWALYGNIHTKKRNRLKQLKAKNLVGVNSNMRLAYPQMYMKSNRGSDGNIDYYLNDVKPVSLFSKYDFNDDEDDTPLYLLQVPQPLIDEWNITPEDREPTDSDFDEDVTDNDCDSNSDNSDSESTDDDEDENSENDSDSIRTIDSDEENYVTE